MIGQTISHYLILKKIGSGGMGEVYLAEDTKLDRKVALKFLPKEYTKDNEANERFQREAKAAAVLNHPNIVTIYEINEHEDQTYIAMEYVEGETLKDLIIKNSKLQLDGRGEVTSPGHMTKKEGKETLPLHMDKIVDIAIQIGEGLQKAHETGIVHRDIKPQNILIDKDKRVKILDFGLAKLKGVSQLTKEQSTLGTLHYMSPEQFQGRDVDQRTDIWSWGVILYEMLTGQPPFKGDYEQAILYSIMNEEPDYLDHDQTTFPTDLRNILKKVIKKDPEQRYQKIDTTIADLKKFRQDFKPAYQKKQESLMENKNLLLWGGISTLLVMIFLVILYFLVISKSSEVIEKSLAVLPFKNMSGEKQNQYFCDGITEDIITQLSKIDGLKVTSRTSTFYFKDKDLKIRDIANELKVATILEGSVRQSKDRVRITAQLINARTDAHLWADTYDRKLKDIFDIQTDVSTNIAKTLKVTLFPELKDRLNKKPTDNMEAYQIYLQGKFYWNKRSTESLKKAIYFFEKAVSLDPKYALGYSGLAETYVVIGDIADMMGGIDFIDIKTAYQRAEECSLKALSLDNDLAEAYAALGEIKCDWSWDFPSSEKALKKAIELNPNYATAHQWLAEYYNGMGKIHLAREAINKAMELDPFSFIIQFVDARLYLIERNYDKSIEIINEILSKNPNFHPAHLIIAHAYLFSNSYNLAFQHVEKFRNSLHIMYLKIRLLARQGKIDEAKKLWRESVNLPGIDEWPGAQAIILADLGRIDEAIKYYKKAIQKRSNVVLFRHGFGRCDALTNDPRVKQMLREAGFDR
jgi:serine/threonine protein kinase